MQRRTVASIAALLVLTLTAGCVGALGQPDDATAADANRTITVTASGDVTAEADQAVVRVSVVARGDTAETARQRLAENASSLREGLAAANLSEDQIRTVGFGISEERRDRPTGPNVSDDPTYLARQSFELTLSDTDRAGEIVDVAVGSGAKNVDGVQFTLSESAQESLQQDALREAMDAARRNAETLAATENLSVDGALHIRTTDLRPIPYAAELAVAEDSGGRTVIDGGPVTVTATVQVVYAANSA